MTEKQIRYELVDRVCPVCKKGKLHNSRDLEMSYPRCKTEFYCDRIECRAELETRPHSEPGPGENYVVWHRNLEEYDEVRVDKYSYWVIRISDLMYYIKDDGHGSVMQSSALESAAQFGSRIAARIKIKEITEGMEKHNVKAVKVTVSIGVFD